MVHHLQPGDSFPAVQQVFRTGSYIPDAVDFSSPLIPDAVKLNLETGGFEKATSSQCAIMGPILPAVTSWLVLKPVVAKLGLFGPSFVHTGGKKSIG